jgi:hypothetical protein
MFLEISSFDNDGKPIPELENDLEAWRGYSV